MAHTAQRGSFRGPGWRVKLEPAETSARALNYTGVLASHTS
jgi:hypothetical protein